MNDGSDGLDKASLLGLLEVSRELVTGRGLDSVLNRVLSTARELTGARHAALGIFDERREGLEHLLTHGISGKGRATISHPPRGRGVLGLLIEDPRPLRLDDARADERLSDLLPGDPPMTSFLGIPIPIRGEARGALFLTDKPSGPFTDGDEQALVVLAEWAAVAVDNTRHHTLGASRHGELERVVQALEASTEIARAIGGETDLERVLELIVKRGRALVQARAMLLLLHDGDDLLLQAQAGQITGSALGRRLTLDGLSRRALRQGSPLRVAGDAGQVLFAADELGVADAHTAMVVPLVYRARNVGVLVAFDRLVGGPQFTAEDEALVPSFAASAAIAVATAQSVEHKRLRQSIESAEQERRRWARELHDATLQGLGALALSLSSAQGSEDPQALDRAVTGAIDHVRYEIATLRALITDLRPGELDDLGITPALQTLITRCRALHELTIELHSQLPDEHAAARLAPEAETAIYRVVQEAITNAAKHAGAVSVSVVIEQAGGLLAVSIRDDGRGFDPTAESAGFGLVGMRERAALAGGRLQIQSSSHGTTVRFELTAGREDAPAAGQASA